jgi:hypothetical protein
VHGPPPLSQNIRTASPPPALLFSLPPTLPTQHRPIPRCGLFFLVLEPRIRPFRLPALSHARPRLPQLRFLRLTRPHQCTFTILAISLVSIRQTVCDAHPSLRPAFHWPRYELSLSMCALSLPRRRTIVDPHITHSRTWAPLTQAIAHSSIQPVAEMPHGDAAWFLPSCAVGG